MIRRNYTFIDTLSKTQRIAGFIYLPFHVFVLPVLLAVAVHMIPEDISGIAINTAYFGLGILFCLTVMMKYMRRAFDILLDNLAENIFSILWGYLLYMVLNILAALALILVMGGDIENPNNAEIMNLIDGSNLRIVMGIAVFLAPVVEEILFRGVLFGSIRRKSRVLAYAVSIILFAFFHVWQYALAFNDPLLLLYALQYVPIGYALAWCYERTSSIWIPIFLHMLINLASMMLLGISA